MRFHSTMTIRGTRTRATVLACAAVGLGLLAAPALAANPWEPNDSLPTATGPIQGGLGYVGAIETSNDVDYFRFYVGGSAQIDVSLTSTGPSNCYSQFVELLDGNGSDIESQTTYTVNETAHILRTVPGPAQYFVRVRPSYSPPCAGANATFQLRIDPASALVLQLPTIPPAPLVPPATTPDANAERLCAANRDTASYYARKIRSYRRQLRHATARRRVAKLRRLIREGRHHRKVALRNVGRYCP